MTFYHDRAILKKSQYEGLKAIIRLFPIGLIGSPAFIILAFLLLSHNNDDRLMEIGLIGTLATAIIGLLVIFIDLRRGCPNTPYLHIRYIVLSTALSLFASMFMCAMIRDTQGPSLIFAGFMIFVYMAAGAVSLSTYMPAQVAWTFFLVASTIDLAFRYAEKLMLPFLILMLLYTGMLFFFSHHISKMLYVRIAAQEKAKQQSEVITLLLSDFEERAQDWLVDLDADGRLFHVSRNFAEAMHRTAQDLTGIKLMDLMFSISAKLDGGEYEQRYNQIKQERKAVYGIKDEVIIDGEHRWWLSSAQPLFGSDGSYNGWRLIGRDITELKKHEETIEWQASHDTFTGLYNRYHFIRMVEETILQPEPASHVLVLIDLVNFKTIRTIRGQEVGDLVIREISKRLKTVKCKAPIARMGGTEFAMLVNRSDDCVRQIRSSIIDMLSQPIKADGGDVSVDICVGLAVFDADASDTETLFKYADLALTSAKEAGAGTMRRYTRSLTEQYLKRITLINDIDHALQNGEFHLRYQPLVSALTGEVVSAEALIRWVHPQQGMIPPSDFIPLAEQSGKITPIGSWVLRQACVDAMAWVKPWRVSVNVSAEQFTTNDLVGEVKSALAFSGLPASRLTLEVTESVLIRNPAHILGILEGLSRLGVSIALDDFGSGFSSLSYLQNLPLHELKIDRMFVKAIRTPDQSIPIIDAIIILAKQLGLKIVAEGVETPLQAEVLKQHGCDTFQGFLFSKPTVQADILKLQLGENTVSQ